MPSSAGPNKWNSTPRRVFDASQERIHLKMQRNKERGEEDLRRLERRLTALEDLLRPLEESLRMHHPSRGDDKTL